MPSQQELKRRRQRVRRLYELGHNDSEIARRLDVTTDTARRDRLILNLGPSNYRQRPQWTDRHRKNWQKSTGFDYVRQILTTKIGQEATRLGFPEVNSATQLDVLRALKYAGPSTIDQIRDHIQTIRELGQMSCRQKSFRLAHSTINTALHKLRKLGLIETIQSFGKKGEYKKGTSARTYQITRNFHEIRDAEWKREQERDKKRRQRNRSSNHEPKREEEDLCQMGQSH